MSCVASCLPVIGNNDPASMLSHQLDRQLRHWRREERGTVHVVLLGTGESGKSTITKQMKIIHINGYSESERLEKVKDIRRNIRDAILAGVYGRHMLVRTGTRDRYNTISGAMSLLNVSLKDQSLESSIEYLMENATQPEFDYPQEFYDHTMKLWADPGFQSCFRRSNEYQLIDSAKYFLDKVSEIRHDSYQPVDQDILRCRVMTNTIQRIDYTVKDGKTNVPFSVFDVGGQRGERQKWIQVFDSATAILFLLDCSSFDQTLREKPDRNRILEALEIFEQVWKHRWLRYVDVILFVNKIDLLDEKIESGRRLDSLVNSVDPSDRFYEMLQSFKSFDKPKESERKEFLEAFPIRDSLNQNQVHHNGHSQGFGRKRARSLVTSRTDVHEETIRTAVFMKRLLMEIMDVPRRNDPGKDWHSEHNCEYFYTCAIDTQNIKKVLNGCKSLIIKKHLARLGIRI